jgi:hypothetical protein
LVVDYRSTSSPRVGMTKSRPRFLSVVFVGIPCSSHPLSAYHSCLSASNCLRSYIAAGDPAFGPRVKGSENTLSGITSSARAVEDQVGFDFEAKLVRITPEKGRWARELPASRVCILI